MNPSAISLLGQKPVTWNVSMFVSVLRCWINRGGCWYALILFYIIWPNRVLRSTQARTFTALTRVLLSATGYDRYSRQANNSLRQRTRHLNHPRQQFLLIVLYSEKKNPKQLYHPHNKRSPGTELPVPWVDFTLHSWLEIKLEGWAHL